MNLEAGALNINWVNYRDGSDESHINDLEVTSMAGQVWQQGSSGIYHILLCGINQQLFLRCKQRGKGTRSASSVVIYEIKQELFSISRNLYAISE